MFNLTNLHSWVVAAVKLIIVIHLFSCGWIYISLTKTHQGITHFVEFTDSGNMISVYFQSLYAICTTISTVGYGDYKGFVDNEEEWTAEMLFLIFVIITGIILFSLVTNEIFNYKTVSSVQKMMLIASQ